MAARISRRQPGSTAKRAKVAIATGQRQMLDELGRVVLDEGDRQRRARDGDDDEGELARRPSRGRSVPASSAQPADGAGEGHGGGRVHDLEAVAPQEARQRGCEVLEAETEVEAVGGPGDEGERLGEVRGDVAWEGVRP